MHFTVTFSSFTISLIIVGKCRSVIGRNTEVGARFCKSRYEDNAQHTIAMTKLSLKYIYLIFTRGKLVYVCNGASWACLHKKTNSTS